MSSFADPGVLANGTSPSTIAALAVKWNWSISSSFPSTKVVRLLDGRGKLWVYAVEESPCSFYAKFNI